MKQVDKDGKVWSRTASMVDPKPEQDVSDMISTFSNLDIDLEEIDDRLIELQDTVGQLIDYKENLDMFKINLSAYCIEKAKILSLIYKFKQVRSIREND